MHVSWLSQHLAKRGHQITVFCAEQSPLHRDISSQAIPWKVFQPKGYFDPFTSWRLRAMLVQGGFDLIHAHFSRDLWIIVPAISGVRHIPIVFIKHIGTQKSKKDLFHRWLYRRVAHVIAISSVIAKNLLATHPLAPERLSVVHHGVDLTLFKNKQARSLIRSEFGIDADDVVIGSIGRLQVGKGHLEFLEMAGQIAAEFPRTKFMIVGEPTHGEENLARPIYQKAAQLGLGNRLIFTGFRTDVPDVLGAMDIFAFPSHAEAFGLVVIEAMAAGLPIVSSACDGVLDIIRDGENGLLIDPKDARQLTDAVRRLLINKSYAAMLASNGLKSVANNFAMARMLEQIEAIYDRVVIEYEESHHGRTNNPVA